MFKRRDRRTFWQSVREAVWPKMGWTRAFHYVKHRVNRLPDQPHRIARGVFAGVLVSFTPFFGFHFASAAAIAWVMRGNILAALLATFFGNPITFPIIAVGSTTLGHYLLGQRVDPAHAETLGQTFAAAGHDLSHNFFAMFSGRPVHWDGLHAFFEDVWLPYLIGGIVPGLISAVVCYYISLPIITAYQNRRRMKLKARLEKIRAKLPHLHREKHDSGDKPDAQ
ncbi:DUF2062 domain-containing protein [Thioclava sp. A2]|nr:DUF2062 domain-containing protein [Thioclava sp. A2]